MSQNYPDTEGFAYSFSRGEITFKGKIYTAIINVEIGQPTEEDFVPGMKGYPLKRSAGKMGMGEGTVTFKDEEERDAFIDDLGDEYREKTWSLSYVRTNKKNGKKSKIACQGCRVLDDPISDSEGEDAIGGDIAFSFMSYTRNGKRQHPV